MIRKDNGKTTKVTVSTPWILFLIFLVLKLVGAISWSWIWVFAPLWISAGIGIATIVILTIAMLILKR